jgi:hypothetical protein
MKRPDRPIQLSWHGEIAHGAQVIVLRLRVRRARFVEAQSFERLIEPSTLVHYPRQLLRRMRSAWRKHVLGSDWFERKVATEQARYEILRQAEHDRMLGLTPEHRRIRAEIESYKARWP